MQLVASISIPKKPIEMGYLINQNELIRLWEKKFLSTWQYVGLAIKISYTESSPSINVASFCETWGVSGEEFHSAIATLNKKNFLQPTAQQLELDLLFDVEKDA